MLAYNLLMKISLIVVNVDYVLPIQVIEMQCFTNASYTSPTVGDDFYLHSTTL